MTANLNELLEGKIDFEGQKLVDNITRIALVVLSIISFIVGFALQSLQVTFGLFSLGTVILALSVLPPWPVYNSHPVSWLATLPGSSPKAKS
ncbi:microsomal signal peptidase 12 kDa subunit [Neolentinus lepideus HHB14362 ss-1]|uniref:Signal peptidase complex subunit 1 n=1 Tax=Neolentinus lepideus HHB14362 ss-1 TaxID=1314782 RepID=A0A165VUR8_9AGAM|nr:microsomal signal peptidase 12 kDa subunit [Neolentinus lepideus HHB14362 ss-1]